MAHVQQASVRNRLLIAMSADDFDRLQPHLMLIDLPLKEVLIASHEPVETLYFMESGISSIVGDGSAGKAEVGIIGREGLVGATPVLLGSDRGPHEHFIQLAGEALRIGTGELCAVVAESPSLDRLLRRYILTELIQVRQTAYINASHGIETRLARWLLICHDRVDGDDLLLTHEFLSMMLGVQRSGVTLALQNLEGSGCIRGKRRRIQVLDRDLLVTVADGAYGTTEAEYSRLIEGA